MAKREGFLSKQRRLPPWLQGRQMQLYTVLFLLVITAVVKGDWIIWLAFLLILVIAAIVALVLRSQRRFL
jgi:hypothetical protein